MKLKKSQVKELIKEVIRNAAEMSEATNEPEWSLDEDDLVNVYNVPTSDGKFVDFSVRFFGEWDDGAFDYEYGSEKGTHRYPEQFNIQDYTITDVSEGGTNNVIWKFQRGGQSLKDFNESLWSDVESHWESIQEEVEQYINENPPETGEREYEPDDDPRFR